MIAEVYSKGEHHVRYLEGETRCGDYCDTCGDCIHCYSDAGYEPCPEGHRWVLYEGDDDARIVELHEVTAP